MKLASLISSLLSPPRIVSSSAVTTTSQWHPYDSNAYRKYNENIDGIQKLAPISRILSVFLMRRAQKETVFGAELSTLSQDESTECPNIVLKLVTELFKPGRHQELQQLYSAKPSSIEVDALCQEIDSVVTSNLRLDSYSSAVVDEALKRIFQRAVHPIIPLSAAEDIDRCGESLNSLFANQQLALMPKVPFLQTINNHALL